MIHPFDDEYFMKRALAEAEQAFREGEIPVGAVVVCQNKIIARAYNQTETLSDVTAHAEMLAITSATGWLGGKYLTGCTLYVTLGAMRDVRRSARMDTDRQNCLGSFRSKERIPKIRSRIPSSKNRNFRRVTCQRM